MAACKSCGAPIRWVKMAGSGKSMPLDDVPSAEGTVSVERGVGHVLSGLAIVAYDGPLFVSHFATCPQANEHRRSAAAETPEAARSPEMASGAGGLQSGGK
jgi:hypothetical protein